MRPTHIEARYAVASIDGDRGRFYLKPKSFLTDSHWQLIVREIDSVDGIINSAVRRDLKSFEMKVESLKVWDELITSEDGAKRDLPHFILYHIDEHHTLAEMARHFDDYELEVA